jgi:hypothetical protein
VRNPLVAHEVGGRVLFAGNLVVLALGVGYEVGVLWGVRSGSREIGGRGLTMVQMLQLSETTYVLGS